MSENTQSVTPLDVAHKAVLEQAGLDPEQIAKEDKALAEMYPGIDPALTRGVTVDAGKEALASDPKHHRVHVEHPNQKPRSSEDRRNAPRGDNDRRKPYGNKSGLTVDQGPARSRVIGLALSQALVAAGKNSTAFPKAPGEKTGGKKQHKRFNPKPAGAARDPNKPAKAPFRHNNKGNNRSVQTNRGK